MMTETFNPVYYRTYSRYINGEREAWDDTCIRVSSASTELGKFTEEEAELTERLLREKKVFCSGRWLWVGGTAWIEKPENYPGAFNCSSTNVNSIDAFGYLMELAMMGCGTGAVLERKYTEQLPPVLTRINLTIEGDPGDEPEDERCSTTYAKIQGNTMRLVVGDSREGWVQAYVRLISLAMSGMGTMDVTLYLGNVRGSGERLKGFGGTANPIKLESMYRNVVSLLNKVVGGKLTPLECCLLIDEAAVCVVAGNVRRSAGMRQFDADDTQAATAKLNLWQQAEDGSWQVDPERDALRMANHTRVFHEKPSYETILKSVRLQHASGEGAIQWAGEAKRRAQGEDRYGLNPCGEICMSDNFCNLSEVHLNMLEPSDIQGQSDAFRAAALQVCALLQRGFTQKRYQKSREEDPIVGVSFTGLFDFFVNAFGVEWLHWWAQGRPDTPQGHDFKVKERAFLMCWRIVVEDTVAEYCTRHGLKEPNRSTTVQPAGCLTVDAVRVFDQGLRIACDDMHEAYGEQDLTGSHLTVRVGIPVYSGIANESMDLIRVTLKNGRHITMTPDHRLRIDGQWVRASEMKLGQSIEFSLAQYTKAQEAIIARSHEGYPDKTSPDLCYLVGLLHACGELVNDGRALRFVKVDTSLWARLNSIVRRLFNCELQKTSYGFDLEDRHVVEYLRLTSLMTGTLPSTLPTVLRYASRDSLLAYFAGWLDSPRSLNESVGIIVPGQLGHHLQQIGEAIGLGFELTSGVPCSDVLLQLYYCHPDILQTMQHLSQFSLFWESSEINPDWFSIVNIERDITDYTYDYEVDGIDDDDSWYFQGALISHNTKSLLTGASPGWHPPKAARFIRRITFGREDPIAVAMMQQGFSVIPSQSDKDEEGRLLDDPYDPRCTEWLVEIPVETAWANIPGADEIDISQFSALAQIDFYMQVQQYYTTHNSSATWEVREHEIEDVAKRIHQAIETEEGYISAAILARFDDIQTYPRLPFEPISKERYSEEITRVNAKRRLKPSFEELLATLDKGEVGAVGPAGCDSDKCLLPE